MGKHNKKISDPGLWRRIVREVRDQRIADTPEGLNRILDMLRDTITPTKITASPSSPDDPV